MHSHAPFLILLIMIHFLLSGPLADFIISSLEKWVIFGKNVSMLSLICSHLWLSYASITLLWSLFLILKKSLFFFQKPLSDDCEELTEIFISCIGDVMGEIGKELEELLPSEIASIVAEIRERVLGPHLCRYVVLFSFSSSLHLYLMKVIWFLRESGGSSDF